ncbi:hypothetical protein JDV02_000906 [Purpureocillium takamizusanense]|uniref:O-methyltransferase C-terminal domain-containing protein n=1 Tax=Purpureocillium takamizusanense TaxID=2060973 RepID=A0A9Q8Q5R2_9HYPO|nr:uncharacterized protein JDV02_000906 [Purpureocillium takamizusanense]UNI14259.1 hypothetical protein JDV02_000906 [Purpureocillium takamizusanense]
MSVQEQLERLQRLASQDAEGDGSAHKALLKGIRDLQLTVESPIETTSRLNFQIMQSICSRIALEYKLLHTLVARDGKPITASELASESGADELLIIRVMRVLAPIGLCDEVGPQTYASNVNTRFRVLPGSIGAEKHHFDLDFGMGGRLVEYMRGPGIHQFADEPGEVTLFEYALGTKTIFGHLERNEEQKKSFDDYMASRRMPNAPQWFEIFPAVQQLGDVRGDAAVLLVDVGGGPGQELARFKERHPEKPGRLILQDLPLTLRRIEKLPEGIEAMEYDFFTPQPVKGARAYFLRDVLHNWSDSKSERILSRIVEAMDPEYSTLLIDDYVLPDTDADLRAAEMDILMWLHTSGLERTVSQWEALFSKVGLELVKIWRAERGNESVIETRVRRR